MKKLLLLCMLSMIFISCDNNDDDIETICPCILRYQTTQDFETDHYDTIFHYTFERDCITGELLPNQPLPPGIVFAECIN
jgi:hypothetical protein